ncbi:S1 family peptidase [Streptomyces sp. 7N604]|uniref:S1 family peptidase n=1 Tax=Streptomyces sp. 7N604 TaxID=3457415 RepID=UPI003FD1C6CB
MNKRTGAIAGAGAIAVVAAAIILPNANASTDEEPSPKALAPRAAAQLGSALADDLGQDAAGWYFDGDSSRLVMNVLNEEAADSVREKGGVARVVENSTAELKSATSTLSDGASVPGTAWSIDPRTNKVVVTADRTVTGTKWDTLTEATDKMDGLVSVKRSAGEFKPFAEGGDAIFGGGSRCSLGFNVDVQGAPGFLTAGHCGNASETWTSDEAGNEPLGTVADSQFPESDFALVTYDDPNTEAPSSVDLQDGTQQEITQAAEASVGMEVTRSGSTTGVFSGTVTGLDATVNYGNGDIVNGLIQTDVCAEPGDSGGSLFSGDAAVGLTSGGSGDCTQGGETFFQPVTAALEATGAEIGAGGGGQAGGDQAGGDQAGGDQAGGGEAAGGEEAGGDQAGGGEQAGGEAAGGEQAGGDKAGGGEQAGGEQAADGSLAP